MGYFDSDRLKRQTTSPCVKQRRNSTSNIAVRPEYERTQSIMELDLIAQRANHKLHEFPVPAPATPVSPVKAPLRHTRNPRLASPRRKMTSQSSVAPSSGQIRNVKMPDLVPAAASPRSPSAPIGNLHMPNLVAASDVSSSSSAKSSKSKQPPPATPRSSKAKPVSEQEVFSFLANLNKIKKAASYC